MDESIMSGDSPAARHRDDPFDFGRSSPPPTTSKEAAGGAAALPPPPPPPIVYASVAVDPPKGDKDKEEEEGKDELGGPMLNNEDEGAEEDDDRDRTVRVDEYSYSGKDRDRKDEKKRLNGAFDKLDGVYAAKRDRKNPAKEQEQEDDGCIVKCLYVTMQCCECSIM